MLVKYLVQVIVATVGAGFVGVLVITIVRVGIAQIVKYYRL